MEQDKRVTPEQEREAQQPSAGANEQPRKPLFGSRKKKEKKKRTVGQEIMSWVWTLLAALLIACVIRTYIMELVRVDGTSMTNTLQDGEIVLVSKLDYLFGDLQRNDVVICRYPKRVNWTFNLGASLALEDHTLFVKRLVALPGDTVQISNGVLYVNGERVEDPEFMASKPRDYALRKLEADEYFVIGDNRGNSHDSRANDVGPLSRSAIMGKVKRVMGGDWRALK